MTLLIVVDEDGTLNARMSPSSSEVVHPVNAVVRDFVAADIVGGAAPVMELATLGVVGASNCAYVHFHTSMMTDPVVLATIVALVIVASNGTSINAHVCGLMTPPAASIVTSMAAGNDDATPNWAISDVVARLVVAPCTRGAYSDPSSETATGRLRMSVVTVTAYSLVMVMPRGANTTGLPSAIVGDADTGP